MHNQTEFERGFRAGYAACISQVREGKIPTRKDIDAIKLLEDCVAWAKIEDLADLTP